VVLQHLTEEEATPAQSNGSANGQGTTSDGLFRSNLAKDDTEDLLNGAKSNGKAGSTERIRAKYMIGCDGAHSWTRRQLGFQLVGEQTDYIWFAPPNLPLLLSRTNSPS
jgi:phenol 2-monooxygenase